MRNCFRLKKNKIFQKEIETFKLIKLCGRSLKQPLNFLLTIEYIDSYQTVIDYNVLWVKEQN